LFQLLQKALVLSPNHCLYPRNNTRHHAPEAHRESVFLFLRHAQSSFGAKWAKKGARPWRALTVTNCVHARGETAIKQWAPNKEAVVAHCASFRQESGGGGNSLPRSAPMILMGDTSITTPARPCYAPLSAARPRRAFFFFFLPGDIMFNE